MFKVMFFFTLVQCKHFAITFLTGCRTEDVLNAQNLFPCEIHCNVFTCVRHYCGLQLLKDSYVQV